MKQESKVFVPKHYSILSDILFYIRHFRQYEPMVLVFSLLNIALGAVVPFLGIYLPKITLDLVEEGASVPQTILVLGVFTFAMAVMYGISQMAKNGDYFHMNKQRHTFLGLLFMKSLRVKYEYTESGSIRALYTKAVNAFQNGDQSASSRMVQMTRRISVDILCFFLYSTVIGTLNIGMLLVIIGLSVANYAIGVSQIRFEEGLRDERALINRHYYALRAVMGNEKAAKDIRIFGMSRWLLQLRDIVLKDIKTMVRKSLRKGAHYDRLRLILTTARDLGAYAYLIYRAAQGEMTAGKFVLYFAAITGFSGFISGIIHSISELRIAANDTDYVRAYLELPEEDRAAGNRHISELRLPIDIEFRNVSFSYKEIEETDGAEIQEKKGHPIFQQLNLTIRGGEKIALVGVNGAGKTTLVKLLCGMYEPDEGEILFNGIDYREFPRNELYGLFSVVFQEPLIFPFTVGENLALNRADQVDEGRAWQALADAGLKEVFKNKKITLKTYMTKRIMDSGIDLSGGQQQRFLLARALYKNGAILVLDEPTAALDPIAESEVYDSYRKYSQGKTAIFISHRLASTRFSDRIVMIDKGTVIEIGTHEELMAKDGAYAEMFRVQSSYYGKNDVLRGEGGREGGSDADGFNE